jgi:hypothetical protein
MNLGKETPKKDEIEAGGLQPSKPLIEFLERKIKIIDEIHKDLGAEYDKTTYESIERSLIDIRKEVKGKFRDITDPDQEFLNHTKLRKDFGEEAIQNLTKAAETFQEARENDRLNRPKATDGLEDVSFSLKNLTNLIRRQSKK